MMKATSLATGPLLFNPQRFIDQYLYFTAYPLIEGDLVGGNGKIVYENQSGPRQRLAGLWDDLDLCGSAGREHSETHHDKK
jgi:hypothetical protein